MTNKVRIVAAILDIDKLVLYKKDGDTVEIKQGDTRIQRIINEITEPLSAQGWADVSIEREDVEANVYRDFEKLVKGAISFFRVHKNDLNQLFDKLVAVPTDNGVYGTDEHLMPVSLGKIPNSPGSMSETEIADQENLVSEIAPIAENISETDEIRDAVQNQKPTIREATDQIMAQAQSVNDTSFTTLETKPDQTMIAAIKDAESGAVTIIPGMENLQAQFARAIELGSSKGAEAFIKRLAAVINDRKHTIDELLNFMSKGDLPIADDGAILAYKVLTTGYGEAKGFFVDCHSHKVQQRVGSFVRQLNVDESRRTECSTGLHIARRAYLGGFSGNVIVLVKIAPEDVIAVPLGEPNKMRARGYHIISEVPVDEHRTLRDNKPLEGTEAKKLLSMAIAGDHIDIIEEVIIGGPKGTEVKAVAKPAEEVKISKAPKPKKKTAEAQPINTEKPATPLAPAVDVKATSNKAITAKTESRTDKSARLLAIVNMKQATHNERRQAAIDLEILKKSSKTSWDKLGLDDRDVQEVRRFASSDEKTAESPKPSVGTKKKKETAEAPVSSPVPAKVSPRQEKVAALLKLITSGKSKAIRLQAYQDLLALKKASKVSWAQLNVENFDTIQAMFEEK